MRFAMFVLLIFCFSVVAYWSGQSSVFADAWLAQGEHEMTFSNVVGAIAGAITQNGDMIIVTLLAMAAMAFASSLMQGFSAQFLVPILIVTAVAEFFVIPMDFLFDNTLPAEIRIPAIFLMNMMLIFGLVDFIRGKT